MKLVLLALAAAMLLTVAIPTQARDSIGSPVDAVRTITVNGNLRCSAVVIAPETAITAAHCVSDEIKVDYHAVTRVIASDDTKDFAVLKVPGLACPCATLGVLPAKGDQVIAVGYPGDREPEREISAVGHVTFIGEIGEFLSGLIPEGDPWYHSRFILAEPNIVREGYSGGALFSMQDGEWRVIGINSFSMANPGTPCHPFFGCAEYHRSGFVPVDVVKEHL